MKKQIMKYEIGQIVSVKMTYRNGKGEITETREVSDRIKVLDGHQLYTENCRWVGYDQISEPAEEQIKEIKKMDADLIGMLNKGNDLMNSLQEPEFI